MERSAQQIYMAEQALLGVLVAHDLGLAEELRALEDAPADQTARARLHHGLRGVGFNAAEASTVIDMLTHTWPGAGHA